MALKYTDRPYGGHGPRQDDWLNRFPAHSQSMDSAPTMGARPVLLYSPDGRRQWGLYHNGAWRGGQNYQDSFTGQKQWRLDGTLINNPVRWSSS
jgi:hypothetical protein